MVCQYGVALESSENMPIAVLLPCQLFIFMSREAHVTGQGKEQTSHTVTQHKPKCVCKGKNTVNTTFLPGLSQLAGGCIPLQQYFRKKKLELGLKTSLPAFLCYKPLRQESMSFPHLCAGAFLGAGPQQSRVSTVMPKILKILF